MTRGAIYAEQAYAQGKMLNNSAWNGMLPRNITPSDIDLVFDNNGWQLLCELSSQTSNWAELKRGQRLLYQGLTIKHRTIGVLLKHSVPKDRQIDTLKDIDSFQVMISGGRITEIFGGERWQRFVEQFYESPVRLHISCYESTKAII